MEEWNSRRQPAALYNCCVLCDDGVGSPPAGREGRRRPGPRLPTNVTVGMPGSVGVRIMLYGADYRSATDHEDARLVRRFRRDVMFVAARPQEVTAAGLIAGLAVVPILLVATVTVAFLFSLIFSGAGPSGSAPTGGGGGAFQVTPTSRQDFALVLLAVIVTLTVAGGLSATLRRYDYLRRGGLRFYLHHPRSRLGLAGFFAPVTAMVVVGLLVKAAQSPHTQQGQQIVSAPSATDRGVLYLCMGLLVSMLLYLVWESCFPLILPTLSDLDVDAEVARLHREDLARVQAEEEHLRSRSSGDMPSGIVGGRAGSGWSDTQPLPAPSPTSLRPGRGQTPPEC